MLLQSRLYRFTAPTISRVSQAVSEPLHLVRADIQLVQYGDLMKSE